MAVLHVQENIKKADGTYDVVHKETETSLVLFDDNETLSDKLSGTLTANEIEANGIEVGTLSVNGIGLKSATGGEVLPMALLGAMKVGDETVVALSNLTGDVPSSIGDVVPTHLFGITSNPALPNEAASVGYVDDKVASIGGAKTWGALAGQS